MEWGRQQRGERPKTRRGKANKDRDNQEETGEELSDWRFVLATSRGSKRRRFRDRRGRVTPKQAHERRRSQRKKKARQNTRKPSKEGFTLHEHERNMMSSQKDGMAFREIGTRGRGWAFRSRRHLQGGKRSRRRGDGLAAPKRTVLNWYSKTSNPERKSEKTSKDGCREKASARKGKNQKGTAAKEQ